jgi:hypothetical protein
MHCSSLENELARQCTSKGYIIAKQFAISPSKTTSVKFFMVCLYEYNFSDSKMENKD